MKTLIAYASNHGAAADCARRLVVKLRGSVETVDLKQNRQVQPELFDRIILGSAIYGGNAIKEVVDFSEKYEETLLQKQIGVYFTCLTEEPEAVRAYLTRNFSSRIAEHLSAFEAMGGAIYFTKMNFFQRRFNKQLLKAVSKKQGQNVVFDGKTDYITLSEKKIAEFAKQMNSSGMKKEQ